MFTLLMAWFDAKYKYGANGLFFATFFIDLILMVALVK
jgi:hypothetical protein